MLLSESDLRRVIQNVILFEAVENEKKEVDKQMSSVSDNVKDFPMSFISKIEAAVDKDLEESEPLGDESALGLAVGASFAAPLIFKGFKLMSIEIAKALKLAGFDVGITKDDNLAVHVFARLEQVSHDLFEAAFEGIGKQVLRLFIDEPTSKQIKVAAEVVKFVVLIGVFLWGFTGLMHAMHNHEFWMTCGETIVNCIEYGEIMYILSIIGAMAQGTYNFEKHAHDNDIEVPSFA